MRRALALALSLAASCRCPKGEPVPPPTPRADDEVKPAFVGTPKQIDPAARALCDALHALPAERKAACCGGTAGFQFSSECARTLSLALEAKSVELFAAEACTRELNRQYEGCGWVGPNTLPLPAACEGVAV